ncbi:MAG: hypothetical protein M3Q65_18015 [Chloroflexota bacterium]|nr:hypothetical protein [Chloroflexota bacterium]
MGEPEIRIERDPNPDAAQLAAWRALWRLLLTPRPHSDTADRHPPG